MNISRRFVSSNLVGTIALLAAFGGTSFVHASTPLPDRVQVTWAPNDQLTEVKQNSMQRGWLRPADWQKSLGDYLRKRADHVLPAGDKLDVAVNDIKLAGDFEPWHGPNAQDIRFMKDVYPPRISLHYTLTDASGKVIREGDSKLTNLSYLYDVGMPTDTDPLRYDKRLLDRWIGQEFAHDDSQKGNS